MRVIAMAGLSDCGGERPIRPPVCPLPIFSAHGPQQENMRRASRTAGRTNGAGDGWID